MELQVQASQAQQKESEHGSFPALVADLLHDLGQIPSPLWASVSSLRQKG